MDANASSSSSTVAPLDTRMYKRSQRATWSCTECSRRKIKCDKQIPCQPCTKRGTAHACSLDHEGALVGAGHPGRSNSAGNVASVSSFASSENKTDERQGALSDVLLAVKQLSSSIADMNRRLYSVEDRIRSNARRQSNAKSSPAFTPPDVTPKEYGIGSANYHPSPAASTHSARLQPYATDSPNSRRYMHQPNAAPGTPSEGVAQSALTFEYLALGRDRNRGILQQQQQQQQQQQPYQHNQHQQHSHHHSHSQSQSYFQHYPHVHSQAAIQQQATSLQASQTPSLGLITDNILYAAMSEPVPRSVQAALLPAKSLDYVLTFHKDVVAWQHACVHVPTFQRECEAFLSLEPNERWYWTDPLWLALFFVIQSVAVHQMPNNDVEEVIGHSDRSIAQVLLEAATRCLEVGRYLSEPSLFTCQALTILCVTGHNVADSNLLSSYLAIGIKTAQMLNLHNLLAESKRVTERVRSEGDAAGRLVLDLPAWRTRIVRLEVGKRIWWSLVSQDYLALPFCGTSMINPRQHDTPFPVNVHDDELDRGELRLEYDENDLTLVQKQRLTSKMAQIVYNFFEHLPHGGRPANARLEESVQPFEQQLLDLLPPTQPRSSNPALTFGLALRRYINIGVSHKILVLHRAFCSLSPPPAHAQVQLSQSRCLDAARQVLEQIREINPSGRPEGQVGAMWTVSYQAVAAAVVIALTHFKASQLGNTLNVSLEEVYKARDVLQTLSWRSTIAERGVDLFNELMKSHSSMMLNEATTTERQTANGGKTSKREFAGEAATTTGVTADSGYANGDHASPTKRLRGAGDVQTPSNHLSSYTSTGVNGSGLEYDFDWDVAGVLHSMPDVSKLFDGSLINPFGAF